MCKWGCFAPVFRSSTYHLPVVSIQETSLFGIWIFFSPVPSIRKEKTILCSLCSHQRVPWTHPPQGHQRFDVKSWGVWISGLVNRHLIYFWICWIFTLKNLKHGEGTGMSLFYYFVYLKVNLDLGKKISLMNLHPTLFLQWWILTQLLLKKGELMVNLDLTVWLKRWTEVKTCGGYVQGALACIKAPAKLYLKTIFAKLYLQNFTC